MCKNMITILSIIIGILTSFLLGYVACEKMCKPKVVIQYRDKIIEKNCDCKKEIKKPVKLAVKSTNNKCK